MRADAGIDGIERFAAINSARQWNSRTSHGGAADRRRDIARADNRSGTECGGDDDDGDIAYVTLTRL